MWPVSVIEQGDAVQLFSRLAKTKKEEEKKRMFHVIKMDQELLHMCYIQY